MAGSLTPKEKRAEKRRKLASEMKEQGESLANLPTDRLPEIPFSFTVKFISTTFPTLTLIEYLLLCQQFSRPYTPQNNSMRWIILFSQIFR